MKPDQLRASILKVSSPKPIRLEVDGIGPVFVQVQTAYDADVMRKKLDAAKKKIEEAKTDDHCEIGRLLACTISDEDGNPLFDMNDEQQMLQLSKLPANVQASILEASNKANNADPKP
jgi:hypothetical protein